MPEYVKKGYADNFKKQKSTIIRSAFGGLKDYLVGVGASATVALIQAKMQGLF